MNIKRCHVATHTKQQTENKQERQMDKQMGKDGKLTRATELGYICWWRWTPWAEGSLWNIPKCSPVMAAGMWCWDILQELFFHTSFERLPLHPRV